MILGFLWKSGLPVLVSGRVLELFFSAGLLFVTYKLASEIFDRLKGLFAATLLFTSPLYLFYSTRLYTEIPSTFFVISGIYALTRQKHFLAGVFAGLGFLTKFPHGLALAVFILSLFLQGVSEKKPSDAFRRTLILSAGFLAAILPNFIFNYSMYHKGTDTLLSALFQPFVNARFAEHGVVYARGDLAANLLFYILKPIKTQWFFIFGFSGIAVMFMKRDMRSIQNKALFLYAVLYFIYFVSIPHKEVRYSLMMFPVFAIFACYGLFTLVSRPGMAGVVVALVFTAFIFGKAVFHQKAAVQPERYLDTEMRMQEEYYSYFKEHPAPGTILTFDPLPAAYTDDLYVPFYVTDAKEALPLYHRFIKERDIKAVMFSPGYFVCGPDDLSCMASKTTLVCDVLENKVLLVRQYYGRPFYILEIK